MKSIRLEEFRSLSLSKRLTVVDTILDEYATIADPLVYDSLNDERSRDAIVNSLVKKKVKPVSGFYPFHKDVKVHANEKKENQYRQPIFKVARANGIEIASTVSINLVGPNIGVKANGSLDHLPYSSYMSWIKAGGKKNAFWGLTNDSFDYNMNLLGYEAGILPRVYYESWSDKVADLLYKAKSIDAFKSILLEFDSTATLPKIVPDIIRTLDLLDNISKPWVFLVNAVDEGFYHPDEQASWRKQCMFNGLEHMLFKKIRPAAKKSLFTNEYNDFIFSQTKDDGNAIAGMTMIAFAFTSKGR